MSEEKQNAAATAFPWRFTAPLLAGSSINAVNSSLIATALVPIAAAMHVSVGRATVLVAVLYLTSAIAQPTGGKLAEEFGPRRVFLAGAAVTAAGGVAGGLGQNLATLIVARVLIGIGSSAGYPPAMLLIRRRAQQAGLSAPPGGVLGSLQVAALVTATLGLPLGGVLVGTWGWWAVFFVNVPFALAALAMAAAWIPRDPPVNVTGGAREVAARIDLAGIAGFAGAMTALLVFLLSLPRPDWIALGLAAILGTALVLWELRAARPFIDVRLLAANGALARTYIRIGLSMLCVYTVTYAITEWLEAGRGMTADETGLLMLPMCAAGALVSRPIARRNLIRGPLLAAALASLTASAGAVFLSGSTALAWIVAVTVIYGITTGTTSIGNQAALYTQVTPAQTGTASGLFRTSIYTGSIASATITSLVFRTRISDHGLHQIAVILTAVSAVVLLMTLARPSAPHARTRSPHEQAATSQRRIGTTTGPRRAAHRERRQVRDAPVPTGVAIPDARDRLFAAAEYVLLRDGPGALTGRAVTTEAHCAKGVLHRHFGSINDFLAELAASHAANIRDLAAALLRSAGAGSVAGNLTTALASLCESAAIAVISLCVSGNLRYARLRRADGDSSPLHETETMIVSYLDAERQLGRVAAAADTCMLAFALTASVILLYVGHDDTPPEPQAIGTIVTALLPDRISPGPPP